MGGDQVFISYSHDWPDHSVLVLEFSNALRASGVDAELDQYHTRPPEGWPRWCDKMLEPDNSKYWVSLSHTLTPVIALGDGKPKTSRGWG